MITARHKSCALTAVAAALFAVPSAGAEETAVASGGLLAPWRPVSSTVERRSFLTQEEEDSYQAWLAQRNGAATAAGSAVHVDIAVDLVSAYFFRGLLQERSDVIVQNSIEVGFDILAPSGEIGEGGDGDQADPFAPLGLTAVFGIWNSFHETATGAITSDEFVEHWYEADLYLGMTAAYGNWTFDALYYVYTSPSDAFQTAEEVALSVSYDDSARWSDDISFNPSATMAIETRGAADGIDTGIYIELGLTPTIGVEIFGEPVDLSFPLTVGVSGDAYYQNANGQDKAFGYIDLGAEFSVALPVDERFGSWSLSGGLHWLVLGDNTQAVNLGRDNQVLGRVGVAISF